MDQTYLEGCREKRFPICDSYNLSVGGLLSRNIDDKLRLRYIDVSMIATDQKHTVELSNIARVQPGYLNRTSVRSVPTGTHRLLQARDVSPQHGLRLDVAVRFRPERNPDLYRVSRGDILLAARGDDHRACLIEVELQDVLASSVFYIIRPGEDMVAGYLAWWLNQPDSQAALESASRGTGIGYIPRPLMEHLPVVVPPLEVQRRIATAMDLWQRQQSIQARLDQRRETLIQATCRKALAPEKE